MRNSDYPRTMNFSFSRINLSRQDKFLERLLEILPAATSWSVLLVMVSLSFLKPLLSAVLIIAFDLYWILRLLYMNIFLVLSYLRLACEKSTDWVERIQGIDNLEAHFKKIQQMDLNLRLREKFSFLIQRKEIENLRKSNLFPVPSRSIYHLIILPVASEKKEIIEEGILSFVRGKYSAKQMLLIISLEESAPEEVKNGVGQLQADYRGSFFDFLVVIHPAGLPGEARVKGANASFAAEQAAQYFKKNNIPYENVIVSCFDADTVVDPDYFSCLTYYYLVTPDRIRVSFQPIPVYHNNIWEAPSFARVLDIGSSFFQLIEATDPERLVTFSSHSMSFAALVAIGYWPRDLISDDSAIFWKAFIHFDGNYRVIPIYTTLSMDVAVARSWWGTSVKVYKQKRRWAWGVENFPIVMRAFLKASQISLFARLRHAFKLFEGHVSWATWPFLLAVISWLPAIFAGREFAKTTVYYSAPRITATIFKLSSLGLFTCIFLSLLLLPKKKVQHNLLKRIRHVFEWLLVPLVSIFFSALPALDAQTHLMFGRYLEFWVTEKIRNPRQEEKNNSVEKSQ